MATNFTIDTKHGVVFSYGTGVYRYADHLDHMARLVRDPRFRPEFDQVIDCRGFTLFELTPDQIQNLARQTVFDVSSRHAFVATSDHHFGLTRMFAAYRELHDKPVTGVFREFREALLWLNLPPDLEAVFLSTQVQPEA